MLTKTGVLQCAGLMAVFLLAGSQPGTASDNPQYAYCWGVDHDEKEVWATRAFKIDRRCFRHEDEDAYALCIRPDASVADNTQHLRIAFRHYEKTASGRQNHYGASECNIENTKKEAEESITRITQMPWDRTGLWRGYKFVVENWSPFLSETSNSKRRTILGDEQYLLRWKACRRNSKLEFCDGIRLDHVEADLSGMVDDGYEELEKAAQQDILNLTDGKCKKDDQAVAFDIGVFCVSNYALLLSDYCKSKMGELLPLLERRNASLQRCKTINLQTAAAAQCAEAGPHALDSTAQTSGCLGVRVAAVTEELAAQLGLKASQGARVNGVDLNGPAARSGLKVGDILLAFNDTEIIGPGNLADEHVASAKPGTEIKLLLYRDGEFLDVKVTLGQR